MVFMVSSFTVAARLPGAGVSVIVGRGYGASSVPTLKRLLADVQVAACTVQRRFSADISL
jgi:hypothetical protein